jgi:hypothetical protein
MERNERRNWDSNSWGPFADPVRKYYFQVPWEKQSAGPLSNRLWKQHIYFKLQAHRSQFQQPSQDFYNLNMKD